MGDDKIMDILNQQINSLGDRIEKKLDKFSEMFGGLNNKVIKLELQVKIMWAVFGFMGFTMLGLGIKIIWDMITNK